MNDSWRGFRTRKPSRAHLRRSARRVERPGILLARPQFAARGGSRLRRRRVSDYESIRELPGIGDYTAAAVASIAFGLPHAAVDGNVRRVAAR